MNKTKLLILSLGALIFSRPVGYCTANGVADDLATLKADMAQQIEELRAQNAALQKQLDDAKAAATAPAEPEDTSELAMLAKGAGVELKDVRWRVQAGLDPSQAIHAAVAQKALDARKAEEAAKAAEEAAQAAAVKTQEATK